MHTCRAIQCTFDVSADGKYIATGSEDKSVRVVFSFILLLYCYACDIHSHRLHQLRLMLSGTLELNINAINRTS